MRLRDLKGLKEQKSAQYFVKEVVMAEDFKKHLANKFDGKTQTASPNFGLLHTFKNVKLPTDPLYWPYLEVLVTDRHRSNTVFHFGAGCEDCFTTISLLDYADKFFKGYEAHNSEQHLRYCQEQQKRNQDALTLVQR